NGHNLVDDPSADDATRAAIEETRRSGAIVQTQTTIRQADDRVAGAALIAPLIATEGVSGVLVAFRVGRSFTAADALTASGVSDHDALAQALHQQRLVRIGHGALRPWVPAETRELIVVPLADRARSLGALVLGRVRQRYEETDEELAGVLGRFVSRLVVKATL